MQIVWQLYKINLDSLFDFIRFYVLLAIVLSGFFVRNCHDSHLLTNLEISCLILVHHHFLLFIISLYVFAALRWPLCHVWALWIISYLYSSLGISPQSNIWSIEIFLYGVSNYKIYFLFNSHFIIFRISLLVLKCSYFQFFILFVLEIFKEL